MNIIEAIKEAENGALITNNILKMSNRFLKYIKNGVFFEFEIVDENAEYKYEVRNFSMGDVLCVGWEIVENKYFND